MAHGQAMETSPTFFPLNLYSTSFLCALNHWSTEPKESLAWQYFLVGLSLWIAFEGLLRPGELLNLRMSDIRVVRAGDVLVTIIAIRRPKTKAHMGRVQFAILRHQGLCQWVKWFQDLVDRPAKPLWPRTATRFRVMLKHLLRTLKLDHIGYNIASCRPGGATYRFMLGESIERLQFQGRWASISSLKAYIQEPMAWICWSSLPVEQENHILRQITIHSAAFSAPPSVAAFKAARHAAEGG